MKQGRAKEEYGEDYDPFTKVSEYKSSESRILKNEMTNNSKEHSEWDEFNDLIPEDERSPPPQKKTEESKYLPEDLSFELKTNERRNKTMETVMLANNSSISPPHKPNIRDLNTVEKRKYKQTLDENEIKKLQESQIKEENMKYYPSKPSTMKPKKEIVPSSSNKQSQPLHTKSFSNSSDLSYTNPSKVIQKSFHTKSLPKEIPSKHCPVSEWDDFKDLDEDGTWKDEDYKTRDSIDYTKNSNLNLERREKL